METNRKGNKYFSGETYGNGIQTNSQKIHKISLETYQSEGIICHLTGTSPKPVLPR